MQGMITSKYDDSGGQCGTPGSSLDTNGGQCDMTGNRLGQDTALFAPRPAAPTCTATASPHSDTVNSMQERVCTPAGSTCAAAACDPSLAPTFQTCAASPGDVACPAGLPSKHLVAGSVDVSCGGCACNATVSCTGSVSFYSNPSCGGNLVAKLPADGSCNTANAVQYGSYQWTGTATVQCDPGASAATVAPHTPSTVCCP
jgi:hypothetical protein